eukprot:gene7556-7701_t
MPHGARRATRRDAATAARRVAARPIRTRSGPRTRKQRQRGHGRERRRRAALATVLW